MQLKLSIWKLTITIDLFDVDPFDRDISFGITISW